jgi:uncharacterized RDD family membrane protein YckC
MTAAKELEYVGFWPRVGASLVDTILIMLVAFPILTGYYGSGYWLDTRFIVGPFDFLVSYVFPFAAVVWFWRSLQATPGKMLIGARVVDAETGQPLSVGQCVLRYLGYFVSMIVVLLGYIWVAFDARRQGWHDKIAGSVVVRARNRESAPVRFRE